MTRAIDLRSTPVRDIAHALRDGAITARALFEQAEENYRRLEGVLNAYKLWLGDLARSQAEAADACFRAGVDLGTSQGLPVSIKDVFGVTGHPTFAGSDRPLPEKYSREGDLVGRWRKRLAVFSGKAHTVPLAFGGLGANTHWGPPRNPWDAAVPRYSGGSSSGTGVSLWQGSCVWALGSDAGGSIRMPASLTGTVGLKTTRGRWPGSGAPPLAPTLDTPGLVARSVADLALGAAELDPIGVDADQVADRGAKGVAGLRIGVGGAFFFDECDPDVAAEVRRALARLEAAGAVLADRATPDVAQVWEYLATGSTSVPEGFAILKTELKEWLPTIDRNLWDRLSRFGDVSALEYLDRRRRLEEMAWSGQRHLDGIDVFAHPTTGTTAPTTHEHSSIEAVRQVTLRIGRNVGPANIWNLCAITLPVALDRNGLPIGLQLAAPAHAEQRLLEAAAAVERVLGTASEQFGLPPLVR